MTTGAPGSITAEQLAGGPQDSSYGETKSPGKQGSRATHSNGLLPAKLRFRTQQFGQQDTVSHSSRRAGTSGGSDTAAGSSAFTELDANQDPIQRARLFPASSKDAHSMGDQAKQQVPAPAAAAPADPAAAAAAPTATWASFLGSFQQQAYISPGGRAAGRRASQRKGATPKASRMQQRSNAAGGSFGSPAGPMFPFGSPRQQAGAAGTAPAQPGAGPTPAPSTLPPGSAMSVDTNLQTAFTAAFSAMSVDATPAPPRAAAVTGKRLFDTPSSAGSDSTPSPFGGSWGRAAAGEGGSAQQGTGVGRAAGEPVPFPGFGGAAQDGTGSPAGGFSFNPGKPSPTPGRSKARQHRSSPAHKPPPAPSFGGFGSPAFGHKPPSSSSANSTPSVVSFAAGTAGAQAGGSSSTPAMPSAGSFRGFMGAPGPGSTASTPGFSPMMWSPAGSEGEGAAAAASPPAPFAAPGADVRAAATAAGFTFGAVDSRQQSSAATQQQADARLQQAQQRLSQQQADAEAAAAAAELAAAAAVDLPSDDSAESIAELLTDLSASGSRPAAQRPAETAAMAGLRQAVEQLSTDEQQQQAVSAQQQGPHEPGQQQPSQQQEQQDVPAFVFGSPDHVPVGAGMARSSSEWLSSPGGPGVVPTTLFDMSPLKASLNAAVGMAATAAPAAAASVPAGPSPAAVFNAAAGTASGAPAAPPASVPAGPSPAAAAFGAAAGGVSFTPGKVAGTSGKGAAARSKKHTPAKQQRPAGATAAAAAAPPAANPAGLAASFGWGAKAAAAGQPGVFGPAVQQDRHQQPPQQLFGGAGQDDSTQQQQQQPAFGSAAGDVSMQEQSPSWDAGAGTTPGRRKVHATQRRRQPAEVQQQHQQAGFGPTWPPSSTQQPGAAATAAAGPSISFSVGTGFNVGTAFTVGTSSTAGSSSSTIPGKGTPTRRKPEVPPKGRPSSEVPQQQQQEQRQQADVALLQALQEADVWTQRAQMSFGNRNWAQADAEFKQGMDVLKDFRDTDKGSERLSNLHVYRAAVRIGGDNPEGALVASLDAIRVRRKNIEAYLRAATCLSKLGCLAAADRVLDKVLDMISANHKEWSKLNSKRMQVHQLAHQQQRVVAAALGCDTTAAAATLAALSAGQPVQHLLDGFVSVSVRQSSPGSDAVAALAEDGTSPLEDSAAAEALIKDAKGLVTELTFWEDGPAMLAWLLLRSGQLETAASIAEAAPNGFFSQQPQHSNRQWGWRWWVLAQVKWHQGDLSAVKSLLQQGQQQLPQQQQGEASGGGNSLWRLLVPQGEELGELLVQVQQLLSLKEAGNAAIQAKQCEKAVEAYGKALGMQPSCGFAAVIHSNRAAALQQQQRLVEALADCSRAVALDPKYARAYLRMAQVLESLHRSDRAVVVLQDALKGPANAVDPATTRGHELTHGANVLQLSTTDRRKFEDMLATAQVAARRFKTAHHYKALGLTMSATEADIRKAYRALALKHHPDKALQHCRWSAKLGRCGAAAAHVTAASGGVEASLKAAANEVFGFLSTAHEELTNATSRSKLDRDLRTEEQLYSNSSSSSYSRPASYTYSYGGRRADADYGFDDFFRRTAAAHTSRQYQQPQQPAAGSSRPGRGSSGAGSSRPGGGSSGGGAGSRWYDSRYWQGDDDFDSDEDESTAAGGTGYHYRSKW